MEENGLNFAVSFVPDELGPPIYTAIFMEEILKDVDAL